MTTVTISISIPKELLEKIESQRNLIPRSTYIVKLLGDAQR
jgi:metal-responsive CopG/Arc/MetJ family transcriptional regulator